MSGQTSRASKLAAVVLFIVNFIVIIFCGTLFGLALWMISAPAGMARTIQNYGTPAMKTLLTADTLSLSLGIGTAAIAVFFFMVAFMGLYGAINRSPFLLFMYSTLILLLLLLECALLFYFSSSLTEKGLQEQDGQWTHSLRLLFKCCEFNNTSQSLNKIPWSCCGTSGYPNNCTSELLFTEACQRVIPSWLSRYQTAMYATLAVLHIVLSSCALVRRSRR